MKHILTAAIAGLVLAACSGADTSHTDHGDHKLSHEKGIVISEARFVPPFPGRDVSAAYFTLTNHGDAARLVSVTSPISDAVEIHNHVNDEGVMKMMRVEGVDLPAGESVEFKPGSYHVMMFKSDVEADAADVALNLNFDGAPSVTVIAENDNLDPKSKEVGSHSGH